MARTHIPFLLHWLPTLFTFLIFSQLLHFSLSDVGTAARYGAPYLPTRCYSNDESQIPSSNLFAAAGEGIWDNGASCGREYQVRCITATVAGSCKPDTTVQVKIVDYSLSLQSPPSAGSATIVLSQTAFGIIANSTATSINIEFQQV